MIIPILLVLAVILVVVLLVAALQPAEFLVERSISLAVPAAVAFGQVNDLRKWQEMSPYAKLDPAATYSFEGPPAGVGASMVWTGNNKIGEGRTTITDSRPNELVRMKLEFVRPFTGTNTADFTFRTNGDQTAVMWRMFGEKNFVMKVMGLVVNMDKMIGGEFENGLANLKALAEGGSNV